MTEKQPMYIPGSGRNDIFYQWCEFLNDPEISGTNKFWSTLNFRRKVHMSRKDIREICPEIYPFFNIDSSIERHNELLRENGIDPETAQYDEQKTANMRKFNSCL